MSINTDMSPMYKAMIYYVHAALNCYNQELNVTNKTSVSEFRQNHPELINHIFQECLVEFGYELSHHQMSFGILSFIQAEVYPVNIKDVTKKEMQEPQEK